MLQHFSAHGQYLGSREIPNFFLHGLYGPEEQRSYALYCEKCGTIWAKIQTDNPRKYWLEHAICRDCGGGELACRRADLYWSLLQFQNDWPPQAVEWEFFRLLERAEKELEK